MRSLLNICVFIFCIACLFFCTSETKNKRDNTLDPPEYANLILDADEVDLGRKLALTYCANCHVFPEPDVLPKAYWNELLLPAMGRYYGIQTEGVVFIDDHNPVAKARIDSAMIIPKNQLMPLEIWKKIKNYYLFVAPESVEQGKRAQINYDLDQFDVVPVPWKTTPMGATMVKLIPEKQIAVGYSTIDQKDFLFFIDTEGIVKRTLWLPSPMVSMARDESDYLLNFMGSFQAIDEPTGIIGRIAVDRNANASGKDSVIYVLEKLERPVNIQVHDMDDDGRNDLIISEFGKELGGLYLYYQTSHGYDKSVIFNGAGAISSVIKDANDDGKPDIYTLISQGDEGFYLFLNKGKGEFQKIRLTRFPSYYGSAHFSMVDFDGDGLEDILYSNGDSGDFGTPPKRFHGIRLLKNFGNHEFKEDWFFPQQGAFGAYAHDFDDDGDKDIASISFYAINAGYSQESFFYLKNSGMIDEKPQFEAYSFLSAGDNPWIMMDTGDIDDDGDVDIVLGANMTFMTESFMMNQFLKWQDGGGAITILENKLY